MLIAFEMQGWPPMSTVSMKLRVLFNGCFNTTARTGGDAIGEGTLVLETTLPTGNGKGTMAAIAAILASC